MSESARDGLADVLAPILESYRRRNPSDRLAASCDAACDTRAALAAAGYAVVPAKHTDRSVPCPTCGFRIRQVKEQSFVFEDDAP